jgi:hypothetical protein
MNIFRSLFWLISNPPRSVFFRTPKHAKTRKEEDKPKFQIKFQRCIKAK